ncbi:hypothetical protein EV656_1022 [Rhodovulum adriaticum]|uniref:Uncharacterized protein n=1 Tax=Rhodovulum adriaticum TaxID=35804 RepID=A0A4R2NWR1_RHOAD|nr:hypothetical protein EV656_1022 [Rhodovulum adriaticum]
MRAGVSMCAVPILKLDVFPSIHGLGGKMKEGVPMWRAGLPGVIWPRRRSCSPSRGLPGTGIRRSIAQARHVSGASTINGPEPPHTELMAPMLGATLQMLGAAPQFRAKEMTPPMPCAVRKRLLTGTRSQQPLTAPLRQIPWPVCAGPTGSNRRAAAAPARPASRACDNVPRNSAGNPAPGHWQSRSRRYPGHRGSRPRPSDRRSARH